MIGAAVGGREAVERQEMFVPHRNVDATQRIRLMMQLPAFLSLLSFSESAALASKEKDRNTDKGIKNKSRDSDNNSNINRDPNGKS